MFQYVLTPVRLVAKEVMSLCDADLHQKNDADVETLKKEMGKFYSGHADLKELLGIISKICRMSGRSQGEGSHQGALRGTAPVQAQDEQTSL